MGSGGAAAQLLSDKLPPGMGPSLEVGALAAQCCREGLITYVLQTKCVASWYVMSDKVSVRSPYVVDLTHHNNAPCVQDDFVHDGTPLLKCAMGKCLPPLNFA